MTPGDTTPAKTRPDADEHFMGLALELAREAALAGEVPVGAVVVTDGRVIGRGRNAPIERSDATAHAEIQALRAAGRATGNYRLGGATLYSTIEPCLMCYGAALQARIGRLVYGASDPKLSSATRPDELAGGFNHRFESRGGVLADQAARLLLEFFKSRRPERHRVAGAEQINGEVPKWP